MGLRDMLRAIREYPAVHAELETVRFDLRQVQQTLEKSQEDCVSLQLTLDEQKDYTDFLSHKVEALQDALNEFCPRLSTPEEMKRLNGALNAAGILTTTRGSRGEDILAACGLLSTLAQEEGSK